MSRRYSVHAGHSASSPGTSGNGIREHEEARWVTTQMINRLNAIGNTTVNATSNASGAANVVNEQVRNMRNSGAQFHIANHFNGFSNASARGVEVLYRGAAMLPLARAVSATIARELGIPNRGPKQRTNIGVLNNFPNNTILIEWCFLTNAADVAAWRANRTRAVQAVVNTIVANTGGANRPPAATTTPPAANSNPHDIRTITRQRFRVTANPLNVRNQPTATGNVRRQLARDTVFWATQEARAGGNVGGNRRWINTGDGWVSAAHLAGNVQQWRTGGRVNLRASHGTGGRILRTLNANTTVTAISTTTHRSGGHTWRHVATGGQRGWIAVNLLSTV